MICVHCRYSNTSPVFVSEFVDESTLVTCSHVISDSRNVACGRNRPLQSMVILWKEHASPASGHHVLCGSWVCGLVMSASRNVAGGQSQRSSMGWLDVEGHACLQAIGVFRTSDGLGRLVFLAELGINGGLSVT